MAYPAKYPQLNETELTEHARDLLVRVIRVAFPHPTFPDSPYQRTANIILEESKSSTWLRVTLTQGLLTLDSLSAGDFTALDEDQATAVLRSIEHTDFFGFIRRTTVLNLYDDPEVWQAVGYEGSSFELGGYVHRGFNDLDWVPEPLIEEPADVPFSPLPGLKRPQTGAVRIPAASAAASAADATGDGTPISTNQPGELAASHEGVER
ncbi:hypothetical protein [Pseudoclavibacter terrae]|uniref:hypothetical protein n=1 Tax=Pseudoclavibacter terrae TaxID=1530195 RepID=UPI0023311CA7|nr:hypothetical protein [Pseudoclavibacter terrae]